MAVIRGTYGGDVLTSNGDTVHGSFGNDLISGGALADILYGDQQDDELFGFGGGDFLYGGSGNDSLTGGEGADSFFGGEGDDWLDVGAVSDMTSDKVVGGSGVDTLGADFAASTSALIFTALDPLMTTTVAGRFTASGVERFHIGGTAFDDQLSGYFLADIFHGGAGADLLNGNFGADDLFGDLGKDTISGGGGNDNVDGGDDSDTLYGQGGNDDVRGGLGVDQLFGGNGVDWLAGNAGADKLDGGAGKDTLYGEAGADMLVGGADNDVLTTHSSSSLSGDTGLEIDNADGGAGNDEIGIGAKDIANGGTQFDTITLDFSSSAVGETYALQAGRFTFGNGARIENFEQMVFVGGSGTDTVSGGGFADNLTGGNGNDALTGGTGRDELMGDGVAAPRSGGGNDVLHGGGDGDTLHDDAGDDKLYGDEGDDILFCAAWELDRSASDLFDGGLGRDTVSFGTGDISVVVDLAAQANNDGRAKNDAFASIEVFEGTRFDDTLKGNGLANTFRGGSGDDLLEGRGGGDVLNGEAGADTMSGGTGADFFQFLDSDVAWRGDTITDFARGLDKLQVDAGNFFGAGGSAAFKLQQVTNPTATTAGPVFLFETDAGRLWFDEDGNGQDVGPVLVLTLNGVTALARSDFDLLA
jgi:Ca2+-binding RTX toxin-like protein